MIRKIKMWLYEHFLPWETKEIYLKDMQDLLRANEALKAENERLRAYAKGMQDATRRGFKVYINDDKQNSNRRSIP